MNSTDANQSGKRLAHSLAKVLGGLCCVAVVAVLVVGCRHINGRGTGTGVGTGPVEPPPRCLLRTYERARSFRVEAWAVPDPRFNVGEPLSAQVRVSTPAYVNMYHVGTSCKVTRLLHNVQVQPAEIADFPRQNSRMIIVKPPVGEEAFYVIATREPMAFIADSDILQGGDGLASIDLSPSQFYQRLDQVLGRINPDDLAVTTLRTSIVGN